MDVKEAKYVAGKVWSVIEPLQKKDKSKLTDREKSILQIYDRAHTMYNILDLYNIMRGFKLIEGINIAS